MALAGLHVEFGFIGEAEHALNNTNNFGRVVMSETIASGTTTQAAKAVSGAGQPAVRVTASADSYVAAGPTPDATQAVGSTHQTARSFVKAGTPTILYVSVGDKVSFAAA